MARSIDRMTVADELRGLLGSRVALGEPLARHTSFRIGGPADLWVTVESVDELAVVRRTAVAHQTPVLTLGTGTNVLVSDRGVRGVVVHLGRAFGSIDWEISGDTAHVEAGAAVPFKKLVYDAIGRGFAGLEFGEGIPGTLGGGLVMNAGAFGGEIGRVVEWLEGVHGDGRIERIPKERLRFEYRRLELPPEFVIASMRARLERGDPAAMREAAARFRARRKSVQPLGHPNAGSIFKNPPGEFAGRLLEAAGAKGLRRGKARVSDEHANFIVNDGGARAADVAALIEELRARVLESSGIRLETEVRLVGEW